MKTGGSSETSVTDYMVPHSRKLSARSQCNFMSICGLDGYKSLNSAAEMFVVVGVDSAT